MSIRRGSLRTGWLVVSVVSAGAALPGCSGSSPTGTGGGGAISMSLTTTSATAPQGGYAAISGLIGRSGGFTGDVTITVTGAPAGVLVTITTQPTAGLVAFAGLINVGTNSGVGTYTMTVTASGTGVGNVVKTMTLTITALNGGGGGGNVNFTMTLDGSAWSASAFHQVLNNSSGLTLTGWNGIDYMQLTLSPFNGPGTYSLDLTGTLGGEIIITQSNGKGWSTGFQGGSGTVTITTFTANHVVGTFSFVALPAVGGATGNRVGTNGSFDLTY
jgi:Family of unknown function (DUF6252)